MSFFNGFINNDSSAGGDITPETDLEINNLQLVGSLKVGDIIGSILPGFASIQNGLTIASTDILPAITNLFSQKPKISHVINNVPFGTGTAGSASSTATSDIGTVPAGSIFIAHCTWHVQATSQFNCAFRCYINDGIERLVGNHNFFMNPINVHMSVSCTFAYTSINTLTNPSFRMVAGGS